MAERALTITIEVDDQNARQKLAQTDQAVAKVGARSSARVPRSTSQA